MCVWKDLGREYLVNNATHCVLVQCELSYGLSYIRPDELHVCLFLKTWMPTIGAAPRSLKQIRQCSVAVLQYPDQVEIVVAMAW
jgi:hypothetical protein